MVILPAGKLVFRKKLRHCDLIDVLPKKKWFYLKVEALSGKGWAVFVNRKKIYAAYFKDRFTEFFGRDAIGRIASALRGEADVEVGVLGENVVELFVAMHPETRVSEDVETAFMETRTLDAIDAAVARLDVGVFTDEWEEGLIPAESLTSTDSEDVGQTVEPETTESVKTEAVEVEERKWVVSFEEFLYSLSDFTGVVKGREGSLEVEVYLKDGHIVGAVVRDEDIVIRGEAALFYLDRPMKVEVTRCEPSVPQDAVCGEDRRSVEALYIELDRCEG